MISNLNLVSIFIQLITLFELIDWFRFDNPKTNPDSVEFSSIASSDIIVDADSDDSSKSIREVIKENVKESADFGKDEDGDGELSNDEDSEDESEEDDIEEESTSL